MARCPFAAQKILDRNDRLPNMTPRAFIMHTAVDGDGTTSLHDQFNASGLASHFYLQRDGGLEQYVDTNKVAAAQWDANGFAISCESWDGLASQIARGEAPSAGPARPWNQAQLDTIDRLARWCHDTHGVPLTGVERWDGSGVGWHAQFYEWAKDGHSCPTSSRIAQMQDVVIPRLAGVGLPPPPSRKVPTPMLVTVQRNDGRVHEFKIINGQVNTRWADKPNRGPEGGYIPMQGGWPAGPQNNPGSFDCVTAWCNPDGRLEVEAMNSVYGTVFHCWETGAGGKWSDWVKSS